MGYLIRSLFMAIFLVLAVLGLTVMKGESGLPEWWLVFVLVGTTLAIGLELHEFRQTRTLTPEELAARPKRWWRAASKSKP